MILLDTDVCIELLRGNKKVIERRSACNDDVALSLMTVAELFYGAEKSEKKEKNLTLVEKFIISLNIIQTDISILKKFGELKATLETGGLPVSDADIMIAATTITKCQKLITGNTRHFEKFEGLAIENWIR